MAEREAKQVIVMRKDLGMRKGKMIAQGAHASLGGVLMMQDLIRGVTAVDSSITPEHWRRPLSAWLERSFTKVCVSVNSETELMRVYAAAMAARMPVKLITDAGHTEFHGVPTRTCLAIGPYWVDEIDRITGELKLL